MPKKARHGIKPKHAQLLAALLSKPSVALAAAEVGMLERSVYSLLDSDEEFRADYEAAAAQLLANATQRLKIASTDAVARLHRIVLDDGQAPRDHIAAAKSILEYADRLTTRGQKGEAAEKWEGFRFVEMPPPVLES